MNHRERLLDIRGQLDRATAPTNNPTPETLIRTVLGVIRQIDSALTYDFTNGEPHLDIDVFGDRKAALVTAADVPVIITCRAHEPVTVTRSGDFECTPEQHAVGNRFVNQGAFGGYAMETLVFGLQKLLNDGNVTTSTLADLLAKVIEANQ